MGRKHRCNTERNGGTLEVYRGRVKNVAPSLQAYEKLDVHHLLLLESILAMRDNVKFGMAFACFEPRDPPSLLEPLTLFGGHATLPKLRNLSLSGVHVEWNDTLVGFRNLRKLVINNLACDVTPSFKEFAAMLTSAPRLEHLNVNWFYPGRPGEVAPRPVVHLPALRVFIFGWKSNVLGYNFLEMFKIGNTLESLTLVDTKSRSDRCWIQDSSQIFYALRKLGSAFTVNASGFPGNPLLGPFISVQNVKRLAIVWAKVGEPELIRFLLLSMEKLEDVLLDNVNRGVVQTFQAFASARANWAIQHLKLHIKILRGPGNPVPPEQYVEDIESEVVPVTTRVEGDVLHWWFRERWQKTMAIPALAKTVTRYDVQ